MLWQPLLERGLILLQGGLIIHTERLVGELGVYITARDL